MWEVIQQLWILVLQSLSLLIKHLGGPPQQVCVCSFMDEINNRMLESQLQKGPKSLFPRNEQKTH